MFVDIARWSFKIVALSWKFPWNFLLFSSFLFLHVRFLCYLSSSYPLQSNIYSTLPNSRTWPELIFSPGRVFEQFRNLSWICIACSPRSLSICIFFFCVAQTFYFQWSLHSFCRNLPRIHLSCSFFPNPSFPNWLTDDHRRAETTGARNLKFGM